MTIIVLALQAQKNDPSNPRNKIAFTLDGTLCFVTNPKAAHAIISQAAEELEQLRFERGHDPFWNEEAPLSVMAARILSRRTDLLEICQRE